MMSISERRACRALSQHRSTQRKAPRGKDDEQRLTADLIELARRYGRYGYRKITALLHDAGWQVNDKRVERIWQREGPKVPAKQPKRGRLWLARGIVHSACGRSTVITSGRTTSSGAAPTMDQKFRMRSRNQQVHPRVPGHPGRAQLKAVDVVDVLSVSLHPAGRPLATSGSDNGAEFVRQRGAGVVHSRSAP